MSWAYLIRLQGDLHIIANDQEISRMEVGNIGVRAKQRAKGDQAHEESRE